MKFSKFQATGNDFILVDARAPSCHSEGEKRPKNFAQSKLREESHWAQLAQTMCDRHFGVGADGLILVQNSSYCDLKMRIFNPDGSEAETCGNGLRCLAKYAIEKGIVSTTNLRIETLSGMRQAKAYMLGNKVSRVEVSMGTPQFQPEQIPVHFVIARNEVTRQSQPIFDHPLVVKGRKLALSLLSMGNPHAVSFVSEPVANFPLAEVGPKVERHPLFPQRTNFEIARVLSRGKIDARVWERGVGETLACGSGACAIAVAAQLHNYVGDIVDIILPGGTLTISWDRVGEVLLTGPVEEVFTGEYLTKGE